MTKVILSFVEQFHNGTLLSHTIAVYGLFTPFKMHSGTKGSLIQTITGKVMQSGNASRT